VKRWAISPNSNIERAQNLGATGPIARETAISGDFPFIGDEYAFGLMQYDHAPK
jgi:hypothetical protein